MPIKMVTSVLREYHAAMIAKMPAGNLALDKEISNVPLLKKISGKMMAESTAGGT